MVMSATGRKPNIDGLGLMNFLGGVSTAGIGDSFYSEIRSESFL